jgi:hypothetical protein
MSVPVIGQQSEAAPGHAYFRDGGHALRQKLLGSAFICGHIFLEVFPMATKPRTLAADKRR